MTNETRYRLMLIVASVIGIYTLVWGLAPYSQVNFPARLVIDVLDWPTGNASQALSSDVRWFSAIGSGLLGALAVFMGGIVAPALRRGDTATVRIAGVAIMVWFVIDSAGSIRSGHSPNAVLNAITLTPMMIPMIGMPGVLRGPLPTPAPR